MSGRLFKVLAIDGGGIKGFYAACLLSLFEAQIRRRDGDDARIVDYADLICGTSTGGLIALALSLRIPAASICTFYEQKGPDIFKGSHGLVALMRQTLFGGKFTDGPLKSALYELFEDHTIADSECLLCIPTYDFTHGTYGVFKFDHPEGNLCRHNTLTMVDVALATAAAPTFFPLAQIENENNTQYVDGGVWANNPSIVGLMEAMWYFVGSDKPFDAVSMLSVAALNSRSGKSALLRRQRSFLAWAPDLFDMSLIAQSEFADRLMSLVQRVGTFPLTYRRIASPSIPPAQAPYIKLDVATPKAFALMRQFATDTYHGCRSEHQVQSFFADAKIYHTKAGL